MSDIGRNDAVRCFGGGRLDHNPIWISGRSIHQVDCLRSLGERRIFPSAGKIEAQAGKRLIRRFDLGAFYMRVEVQIDRTAVDDLRDLIVLVIVVEDIAVQRQCAVKQRVFGAQLECIDEFRFERQRVIGLNIRYTRGLAELQKYRAGWIGPSRLVAVRIGCVDQCLIGEIQLRRPIGGETASPLIPLLIDNANRRIAITLIDQFAWNIDKMLPVVRPAQPGRKFQIAGDVVIRLTESGIGIQRVGVLA